MFLCLVITHFLPCYHSLNLVFKKWRPLLIRGNFVGPLTDKFPSLFGLKMPLYVIFLFHLLLKLSFSPMHTLTNTLPVKLSGQLSGFLLSLCLFSLRVLSADLSQPASSCCRTSRVQRIEIQHQHSVWTSVELLWMQCSRSLTWSSAEEAAGGETCS